MLNERAKYAVPVLGQVSAPLGLCHHWGAKAGVICELFHCLSRFRIKHNQPTWYYVVLLGRMSGWHGLNWSDLVLNANGLALLFVYLNRRKLKPSFYELMWKTCWASFLNNTNYLPKCAEHSYFLLSAGKFFSSFIYKELLFDYLVQQFIIFRVSVMVSAFVDIHLPQKHGHSFLFPRACIFWVAPRVLVLLCTGQSGLVTCNITFVPLNNMKPI